MKTFGEIVIDVVGRSLRSEPFDRESYLAQYPEHAGELREFFENFDAVNRIVGLPAEERAHDDGCVRGGALSAGVEESVPNRPRGTTNPLEGFRIIAEIHRGAQGVVYKAVQRSTDRTVALKVLHARGADALDWFEREVRLVARLRHPHIVTVYDAGVSGNQAFAVMEFVDGVTFDQYVVEGGLDSKCTLRLFAKICAGVAYAHRHGLIHRDLKPSNIVVEKSGEPRVLDFGLAVCLEHNQLTPRRSEADGADFVGTLAYASPEQISGKMADLDTRSDVYSLGVILYEVLTGRRPYPVPENHEEALRVVKSTVPECPSAIRPELDDDVDSIVLKALAKEPAKRYQSVDMMLEEINQYLLAMPINQRHEDFGYVARRYLARNRRKVVGTVLAIGLVATLVAEIAVSSRSEKASAATAMRRFELARLGDLRTLESYQTSSAFASRLVEISQMPPDMAVRHLVRYKTSPVDPKGYLKEFAQDMPQNLLVAVRRGEGAEYQEAKQWIEKNGERLDSVGEALRSDSFRFGLNPAILWGTGWERQFLVEALGACDAFLGRAYLRHAQGDHFGAVGDLRIARRLAADIGDGVLTIHKTKSVQCRNHIYGFLQSALTGSIARDEAVDKYVRFAIEDPPIVPFSPSLLPTRLGLIELLNVAVVAGPSGQDGGFDLARLDKFLQGYLSSFGALGADRKEWLRHFRNEDLEDLVDQYVMCAEDWDRLNSVEIAEQMRSLTERLLKERERNSLLWLFSIPGNEFLLRLRTCSRRQALRLTALAIQYEAEHGIWPQRLTDALPPEFAGQAIDLRTGQPFIYDIVNDMPRIRSFATDDLFGPTDVCSIEWVAQGDGLVTYFPGGQPRVHRDRPALSEDRALGKR